MTWWGWLAIALALQVPASALVSSGQAAPGDCVYLSDVLCGICTYPLEYGKMLGLDATSYPLWPKAMPGDPLSIAGRSFAKGIGAPHGEIVVVLDGQYALFEAQAGVQTGDEGVAYFTVTVDGEKRFESGEMKGGDTAKPVHVPLAGAADDAYRCERRAGQLGRCADSTEPPESLNPTRRTWRRSHAW